MRYRLRTLLIVMAVLPPLLAICYMALTPNSTLQRQPPGHWIDQAKFLGNRSYSDKKLSQAIGLMNSNGIRGWRLNAESAEESRKQIEHLYQQAGYLHADVRLLDGNKPGDKTLAFQINEGILVESTQRH